MAKLFLESNEVMEDLTMIANVLKPLGVELHDWPMNPESKTLLNKTQLTDREKEELLVFHDGYFNKLKREAGYTSRDLIVLHPEVPQLDEMLKKFDKIHTHDDDEVRYIVDGSGIFGFCLPSGEQVKLQVSAGDYINVPKDTEHWFELDDQRRIKAVRYFSGTEGWVPRYIDKAVRL